MYIPMCIKFHCEVAMCMALQRCVLLQDTLHRPLPQCVVVQQRQEDPDTQCGFFRAEVEGFGGRVFYVLAFPRDAQGRKVKAHKGMKGRHNKAAYYRLVRPCTGFVQKDMPSDGTHTLLCSASVP